MPADFGVAAAVEFERQPRIGAGAAAGASLHTRVASGALGTNQMAVHSSAPVAS